MNSIPLERLGRAFRLTRPFFLADPPEQSLVEFVSQYLYKPLLGCGPIPQKLKFNHLDRHRASQRLCPDEQLSEFDLIQHLRDEINTDYLPIMFACRNDGEKSQQLIQIESALISIVQPYLEVCFTSSGPRVCLTSDAVDTLIYVSFLAFLNFKDWSEYIARCSECGRIFLRERADKVFCRKTCRGTKNTRAWRHRLQEKESIALRA